MSEDLDDIVDNLREPSAWVRVVFMLGFAVVLHLLIGPLVLVLALVQALFLVFTGEDNDNLRNFGNSLIAYVIQILNYLTFNSDQRPFPFSDFPAFEPGADTSKVAAANDTETEKGKETASKAATRKASKPKPAAKKTAKKKAKSSTKKTAASEKDVKPEAGADRDKPESSDSQD